MSIDENKRLVLRWFDAVNRGDEAAILAVLSEDFKFEAMLRRPEWMKYKFDRYQFAATPASMSALMVSPIQMAVVDMIAEGNKVAVEAKTDSTMKTGKKYDNAYHLAFFIENNLIKEVREYSCSFLAEYCFRELNPWKDEKYKS
jgi:ketosteroid isomerase-like protein